MRLRHGNGIVLVGRHMLSVAMSISAELLPPPPPWSTFNNQQQPQLLCGTRRVGVSMVLYGTILLRVLRTAYTEATDRQSSDISIEAGTDRHSVEISNDLV